MTLEISGYAILVCDPAIQLVILGFLRVQFCLQLLDDGEPLALTIQLGFEGSHLLLGIACARRIVGLKLS